MQERLWKGGIAQRLAHEAVRFDRARLKPVPVKSRKEEPSRRPRSKAAREREKAASLTPTPSTELPLEGGLHSLSANDQYEYWWGRCWVSCGRSTIQLRETDVTVAATGVCLAALASRGVFLGGEDGFEKLTGWRFSNVGVHWNDQESGIFVVGIWCIR